jgi:CheY-like chemotaxis protein
MEIHEPLAVLLVEDNGVDVEITERVFARSGMSISLRVARDGKEAMDVLLSRGGEVRPALILLDLRLPVIDGTEVLRRIKANPDISAVPVAVLTGASGERPMLESMALGGNMYFSKPISVSDAKALIPAVEKYWEIMRGLGQSDAKGGAR